MNSKMRLPSLELLYHLEAEMSPDDFEIGTPFNAGYKRVIMNIVGGVVDGPAVKGRIERLGGADWGLMIAGTDFMRLDARYTIKTEDSEYLYIRAKGIFTPGPGIDLGDVEKLDNISQDEIEWFSHLRIEAGAGRYNWLNSVVAVGVMTMKDRKICIDAYRLTNFPGRSPLDIVARGSSEV